MSTTDISRHARTTLIASILGAVLLALTGLAGGAQAAEGRSHSDIDPQAAAALAREKGISIGEARGRLAREKDLGSAAERLETLLAGRSGGSYIDDDGNLVVTTLDPASDEVVSKNGARPQRVDDSTARLDAIVAQLNRKAADGARGVQGWFIDVPSNTVVVTVSEGSFDAATAGLLKVISGFGDSVRVEYRPADQSPQPAEYLVGGYQFLQPNGLSCSVGFNTLDALNRTVVLTAGHCTKLSGNVSRNGYVIGATKTANFPGDDFGTFWNSYSDYWQPSPSVYLWNGTYGELAGQWDNPPVGTTVCKSGRTTGWTCGKITARNVTASYPQGLIYGLVQHNACVEGGDSGGANVSSDYYALGVTSGAKLSNGKCLSKFGYANVSWYQPIGEALSKNGLQLHY